MACTHINWHASPLASSPTNSPILPFYLTNPPHTRFPLSIIMGRQTRQTNRTTHPAAPVMSEAAKVKAGITPAKPRAKRMTKEATIRELEARIAQLEKPDDAHPSKEPLVCIPPSSCAHTLPEPLQFSRGSSGGDGVETDPDSDDGTTVGGKRSRKSQNYR